MADGFSELRTHAQLHMPRQPRREKPLHRRPRRERILRERPEARVPPIEEVAHHAAKLEPLPLHQERRVGPMFWKYPAVRVEATKKMSSDTSVQYASALKST